MPDTQEIAPGGAVPSTDYTDFQAKLDASWAARANVEVALALAIGPDAAHAICNILHIFLSYDPSRPVELQQMEKALHDFSGYTRPATGGDWPLGAVSPEDQKGIVLVNKLVDPNKGQFKILCASQAVATRIIRILIHACGQDTTFHLQDPGVANTDIVTCDGVQSIGGIKTFTANVFLSDVNVVLSTNTGTKIGTNVSQKLGFFNATPVVQPGPFTQTYATASHVHGSLAAAALTDNTTGAADSTLQALTSGTVYSTDVTAIRNNFADLAAQHNSLLLDLTNVKQVLNGVISDLKLLGLVG